MKFDPQSPENRGSAIILRVGYKYYCERSEEKNLGGCTPTYNILVVQQLQRDLETYGEPIGQRYIQEYIYFLLVIHL